MRLIWTGRPRLHWPWLHWCLLDAECRGEGAPRDLYIHPLGLALRLEDH